MKERRGKPERRDSMDGRRRGERRNVRRRVGERRKRLCPQCGGELDPKGYCASCRVRVIRVR